MLSLDLRQILPPKMPFFVCQKVQISSKILAQIPNFANFIKFRQKSIFSSRRPVFDISSVFRQKRNHLKANSNYYMLYVVCWKVDFRRTVTRWRQAWAVCTTWGFCRTRCVITTMNLSSSLRPCRSSCLCVPDDRHLGSRVSSSVGRLSQAARNLC